MLQFILKYPVPDSKLKAAFAKEFNVPVSQQYFVWDEAGDGCILGIDYTRDSVHQFGSRVTVVYDDSGVTDRFEENDLPGLRLVKRLAACFGQDLITADFTGTSCLDWLLVKPDGIVWRITEDDDNEEDYFKYLRHSISPFNENDAASVVLAG